MFKRFFKRINGLFCHKATQPCKPTRGITSSRYHGRWYGLMIVLGEQSGRKMEDKIQDKATEILTMLEISNEYPAEFKYVNMLIALEDKKKQKGENLSDEESQSEFLLGIIDAKKVSFDDKKWERLLKDDNI